VDLDGTIPPQSSSVSDLKNNINIITILGEETDLEKQRLEMYDPPTYFDHVLHLDSAKTTKYFISLCI
jgi:hypothetical protein